MDLLLNIDIIVDLCTGREPHARDSELALEKCAAGGGRLWLYTGSVASMQRAVLEQMRCSPGANAALQDAELQRLAQDRLRKFCEGKQWLAALAEEGPVFDAPNALSRQLTLALHRFNAGSIRLLTRDNALLQDQSDLAITPQQYLTETTHTKPLAFIDLAAQQDRLRGVLERRIHRVLHHGQYIMGPEVQELEDQLQRYTGAKHCITVASGTEALLISLMALGLQAGDEVITTPLTFVATAEAVVLVGAKPVFVDIQPDTCNIDPAQIEAAVTPRTRAIIPVSLYGQPADMDEINAIARRHGNIPVIEDAAQSFGATYRGRKSCNLSTIGCTSFFPSKPLGCYGDGGAIFTDDETLAHACKEIRVHGQKQRYVHTRIGVGGRMDTLQCAVVLGKLPCLDQEVGQRQEIARRYNDLLSNKSPAANGSCEGIHASYDKTSFTHSLPVGGYKPLNWPGSDRTSAFAQYTIRVDDRAAVQAALQAASIPSAIHYPVLLSDQPAYRQWASHNSTPIAQRIASQVISLPMHPQLSEADQQAIIEALP